MGVFEWDLPAYSCYSLSCKKVPIMRILRSWLVIPWLAFLVQSSAQPPNEESTGASRIDQICKPAMPQGTSMGQS
jgi:hypothetical protein